MRKGLEAKKAVAAARSAPVYPTKREFRIGNVDEDIVDTGPSGRGVFEDVLNVFAVGTKNI